MIAEVTPAEPTCFQPDSRMWFPSLLGEAFSPEGWFGTLSAPSSVQSDLVAVPATLHVVALPIPIVRPPTCKAFTILGLWN